MLTVEIDRREDPFVYKHPYQLFALHKQIVTSPDGSGAGSERGD